MGTKQIGYFGCVESGGRYIGAMMVTDDNGIPAEFKYTEPIKPTKIQAILYGGSLERYIKLDVIRSKLFKAVAARPEVIFVDNSDVSLLGDCEGIPVAMLARSKAQGLDNTGDSKRPKENELLVKDHETRDPLRVVCHPSVADRLDRIESLIMELSYSMDVAEPLERVVTAIDALLKESGK